MYSGGLDSLCVLHKVLTEPEYADQDVHVHHMRLNNKENRAAAEEIAVKKTVAWFRDNGYRKFVLSFTDLNYPEGTMFRDAYAVSMIGGQISGQDPMIITVAIGINADDLKDTSLSDVREKSAEIFGTFSTAKKIYPAINMTKKEVIDSLPKELVKLSWSCRTPLYRDNKAYKCMKCGTCRQLRNIMMSERIRPTPKYNFQNLPVVAHGEQGSLINS